jgi:thymidylate kinase
MQIQKKINTNSKRLDNYLAEQSEKLKFALDKIIDNHEKYVLLGNYPNLPQSYSGNDIDILVSDINIAKEAFKSMGFVIRQQYKFEFRAFLYIKSTQHWIAIDVETVNSYPSDNKPILEYILDNRIINERTGFSHPSIASLSSYKIVKYLINGFVHSKHQLLELNSDLRKIDLIEIDTIKSFINNLDINEETKRWVNFFIESDKSDLINNNNFYEYIDSKRLNRHTNRIIYQGEINTRNLFTRPRLTLSLLRAMFIRSKHALPAIAIVGNDGSGKTSLCQQIKDELYKLDVLHIVMRGNESWLPGWNRTRQVILNYIKKNDTDSKIKSFSFIIWILAWIGEIGDFIDRLFRYKVGMAWANSGFGFTIFERYPTDRLRGEYPGPKWSLFPIEQYFPMPDLIVLLDVDEGDSLKRKSDDGHTYQEMHEKRENYLRLIDEIRPSVVISPTIGLDEIQGQLSKLIWDYSLIKQQVIETSVKFPAKWAPKLSNKRQGRNKQKNGFL